ncbi:hypothetical protein OS493_025287 [Desmophyllum pertusum]|uniref:Uncharacterized protein n=1 Tax=Desmophyllum pertusum TaxID=174260 RepID=A0A9W9ZA46_9CNID|nr:hypothetical protein OS493_025287 [Desmophyllum pertusum]
MASCGQEQPVPNFTQDLGEILVKFFAAEIGEISGKIWHRKSVQICLNTHFTFNLSFTVPDVKEEEQPGVRCRRNSDSFLYFKPNEDEVALMKLKHAENKWNIERQILEEEIMKLKKEVVEAGNKSGRNYQATCFI